MRSVMLEMCGCCSSWLSVARRLEDKSRCLLHGEYVGLRD